MRLELAGSIILPNDIVLTFTSNQNFIPQTYLDLGYTHFEVICIGGGGGAGGGIDTGNIGTLVRSYGGSGGGGGLHRVKGLLEALGPTCPIVIGAGGIAGVNHASNPSLVGSGGNGGATTFNGTTCQASGGTGGFGVRTNGLTLDPQGWGGTGGVGGRTTAGGGASGGATYANPNMTVVQSAIAGVDGTYADGIGQGGGGGAGGIGKYPSTIMINGSPGGRGSYNATDISVFGPGGGISKDPLMGVTIVPGGASGAKASPLNSLPYVYGQSKGGRLPGDPGVVVIRLTSEV